MIKLFQSARLRVTLALFRLISYIRLGQKDLTGVTGERLAVHYLRSKGYHLLFKNLRLPAGELDLVVWSPTPKMQQIVLVEVKTRLLKNETETNPPDEQHGAHSEQDIRKPHEWLPEMRVGKDKREKLTHLAKQFRSLMIRRLPDDKANATLRIDILGVDLTKWGANFRHYEGIEG